MELLIVLLLLIILLPQLGIVIPAPLNKVLGIVIFVIIFYWLLNYLR